VSRGRPGRRLDHVRNESLLRLVVEVAEVPAAGPIARFPSASVSTTSWSPWRTSLPSMWLRRSKSPRWATPSSSPNSPGGRNGKRILDIGGAARVVAQFLLSWSRSRKRLLAGQDRDTTGSAGRASTDTLGRRARMAEELDLHLLELRERKVKFRGVISLRKLLPTWAMPNGIRTRCCRRRS